MATIAIGFLLYHLCDQKVIKSEAKAYKAVLTASPPR